MQVVKDNKWYKFINEKAKNKFIPQIVITNMYFDKMSQNRNHRQQLYIADAFSPCPIFLKLAWMITCMIEVKYHDLLQIGIIIAVHESYCSSSLFANPQIRHG
jgi:hypothetical protein